MRENRTHGSEGGEGTALPDPYRLLAHRCIPQSGARIEVFGDAGVIL